MIRNIKSKIIASLIILILIMQISVISIGASKSSLQSQQSTLNSKIKEAEQAIENIKSEKSEAMKEVENLISQIAEYESQIDELNDQISELNTKISEAESALNVAQEEYNTQEELLNERLVLMYEDGDTSYLDFMLSSEGLTDFISNYFLISELAQYDTDLLEQIEVKKQNLEQQRANLESNKQELNNVKASKEQKQAEVMSAKASKESYVAKLSNEEKAEQSQLEEYEATKRDITNELKKIAEQEAAQARASGYSSGATIVSGNPSSSGYIFPVAGCSKSNIRNKTFPSYRGHTGVDINIGVTGKSVVAVKAGKVVKSLAYIRGGSYYSYGECIVISHSDGTMTLYAHMLSGSRRVQTGDTVSQGQVIGTVGSTGNSTGNHLHFEVRIGGRAVNPLPYLP